MPTNDLGNTGLPSLLWWPPEWSNSLGTNPNHIRQQEANMTTLPVRRQQRSLFPELSELFAAFPSFSGLRPAFDTRLMRLEDQMKDGRYEICAEIPGVDPAKDVDITLRDGQLTIKAERSEKKEFDGRSEFSYGSFVRTVSLPAGADEDDVKATYDKGILTVSVAVTESKAAEKHVPIASAN
jgi:HSP20 family protein